MRTVRILPAFLPGLVLAVGALLVLGGCAARPTSYTALYEAQDSAVRGVKLSPADAEALARRFVDTFDRLGSDSFLPAADRLFARQGLYINDTLSVYRDYAALHEHLSSLNQAVHGAQVELIDHWQSGDSVFVHWRMGYTVSVLGVQRDLRSHGISRLKTDADGRIIFQQDYWDGNNGLYRQLPVVGWFYRLLLPVEGL